MYLIGGAVALGVFALAIALTVFDLEWKRVFLPKYEDVKRETYEKSKSYVHGKVQELGKHMLEYHRGDAEEKAAIKSIIAATYSDIDADDIKAKPLRDFLVEMRGY